MRTRPNGDPVTDEMHTGPGASAVLRDCPHGHPNPCGHPHCGDCGDCGDCGAQLTGTPPPMWTDPAEAIAVIRHPSHVRRTLLTTVVVGTLLFCINQLDVVLAGDATATVWAKSALTYAVPFAVSNVGILIATHRRR